MKTIIVEVKNKQPKTKEEGKIRVAAYCRVSTLKDEQRLSYESQCSYYQDLISSNDNMELVGVYGDQGFSGLHADNRPQFQRLINDAKEGKMDQIIVKSISRFSRNAIDCQEYINTLKDNGVRVFFERERLYGDDTQCTLILKLLSAAAQEESNSISQTIKWSIEKNCESGYPTRVCSYGYQKADRSPHDKHIWLIDEEEAKRIRLMFKLAEQGKPLKEIASALQEYETIQGTEDIWTESKVRYRLRNEVYKGDILTGKTFSTDILSKKRIKNSGQSSQFYIEDHHEPIVERELFDRVQRILERKRK